MPGRPVEKTILGYVFGDLFSPQRLAYLTSAVDAALARFASASADLLSQRQAALRDARRELDNIANAIRRGIITPTTKELLQDAERRVAALEEAVRQVGRHAASVVSVESVVRRYLMDLRETLASNVDEARRMLGLALDKIVLHHDGEHLVARVTGNLAGLLSLEGQDSPVASAGAGRGISSLAYWPLIARTVA